MRDETVSNGGLSSIPHSTLSGRSGLGIDDVLIISCDRYGPWNGRDTDRPDHVWADLPMVTGVPMLVYCEREPAISVDAYRFGSVEFVRPQLDLRERVNVLVETVRDVWRSLTIDRRLSLGFGPVHVARHVWRRMRRRPLSPHLARMQVARRVIADELRRRSPRVILVHGEFGPWGLAVTAACRSAGVVPIGLQHGPMSADSSMYREIGRIKDWIPDGLLCVSEDQTRKWSGLPIPVATLGSRRVRWSGEAIDTQADMSKFAVDFRPLVLPPSIDSERFARCLKDFPTLSVCIKPHPLHTEGWMSHNVEVVDGGLKNLVLRFPLIVTGSPGIQLTLALWRVPYVRVRSSDTADWPDLPECPVFDDLAAALDAILNAADPLTLRAHHVPDDFIPPDVTPTSLKAALRDIGVR